VVVPDRQLIMENMLMAEVRAACVQGARPRAWSTWLDLVAGWLLRLCAFHPFFTLSRAQTTIPNTIQTHPHLPNRQGFVEAKMLAKKFASLYFLLEDLLSPAKHYDWGLRAIKSVLVVAGSLLRAEEGQVESQVLFRALRDFNIPKILAPVSETNMGGGGVGLGLGLGFVLISLGLVWSLGLGLD